MRAPGLVDDSKRWFSSNGARLSAVLKRGDDHALEHVVRDGQTGERLRHQPVAGDGADPAFAWGSDWLVSWSSSATKGCIIALRHGVAAEARSVRLPPPCFVDRVELSPSGDTAAVVSGEGKHLSVWGYAARGAQL